MTFDESRVYTAVNADKLHEGDIVIVGKTISDLKYQLDEGSRDRECEITHICREDEYNRFIVGKGINNSYPLAYLINKKKTYMELCTRCKGYCKSDYNYALKLYYCNHFEPIEKTGHYILWNKNSFPLDCNSVITDKYGDRYSILSVNKSCDSVRVCIIGSSLSMQDLYDNYTYDSGKTCGEWVEE